MKKQSFEEPYHTIPRKQNSGQFFFYLKKIMNSYKYLKYQNFTLLIFT